MYLPKVVQKSCLIRDASSRENMSGLPLDFLHERHHFSALDQRLSKEVKFSFFELVHSANCLREPKVQENQ